MKSVRVVLELMPNGQIDVKSSVGDAAIIILVMEKAKLKILQNLELKEESSILVPGDGFN